MSFLQKGKRVQAASDIDSTDEKEDLVQQINTLRNQLKESEKSMYHTFSC